MGNSLQKQVLYRLLAALAVSSLVVMAATTWFQSRALEQTVHSKERDEYGHFQGRMANLEKEWEGQAMQLKLSLEFTRILEAPKINSTMLNAFFLVRSSGAVFTRAMIRDSGGNLLFQYGIDEAAMTAFAGIVEEDIFFNYPADLTLYRIFKLPVWMGKAGTGSLFLLTPLDSALLSHIAYPRTDLYLLFNGTPVSSSLGRKGIEQFPALAAATSFIRQSHTAVSIPWTGAGDEPAPVLFIRSEVEEPLSRGEITLIVLASLAVLALASWRLLGAWIGGIIREIVLLKASSDTFARERKPLALEARPVPEDRGARADELGALETGLASMMQTVMKSEKLYKDVMEALRKASDIKAAVVDTVDALVVVIDTQGRLVSFNKACERATGFTAREVIGTHLWDELVLPEEAEPVMQVFHSLVAGKFPATSENYWRTRDGGKRLIAWSSTVLPDQSGEVEYVLATGIDITESRAAEQALKQSEEKFRTIFNSANDVIFIHDIETGAIVDINRKAREMYGYEPEEMLALGADDLSSGAPPYGAEDAWRWLQKAATGDPQLFEWHAKGRSGRLFWVEVNMRRARIGAHDRIVVAVRDITERKLAEEKVLAALAEKELLLKEIHHRVKNNLQIIASLLYLQTEEAQDPKTRGLLRESRDRIKSMALVHEKLYSAKDLSRIDFPEYCGSLGAYLFSAYGAAKGVQLEITGSGIFLEVDTAIPCGLIISELLSNSLKYAFPGKRQGLVRVAASQNGSGVLDLTISDDGVGLPQGMALDRANSLGLRLVHKLTGQLHGRITAVPGNGAVFHLTIPPQGRKGKGLANGE